MILAIPLFRAQGLAGPALVETMSEIIFSTTCKGRALHVKQTLPRNLANNPRSRFLILDYSSDDDLIPWLRAAHSADIAKGRVIVYSYPHAPKFHMAHAKNMAHRCAIHEGAEILVTLDADNFAGDHFEDFVDRVFQRGSPASYACPDFASLPRVGHRFHKDDPELLGRGFAGRLAIRAQDFIKVGGYNQEFNTWGREDIDILARLERLGLFKTFIDKNFLRAIAHGSGLRFREYPDAIQHENNQIYATVKKAHDTVVNWGDWGCGTVIRNFEQLVTLNPLPTRIFGIGFQRTGTLSLHQALQILSYDSAHWESADFAQSVWREMNRWGSSRTLERYYALTDNPIPILYEKLDQAYPGSKFILTVRNTDEWLASIEKFWTYEGNPRRWTWDIDRFSHKMHGMIYGRADFDPETFRTRYNRHNLEVVSYFGNRHDLLIMDMSRGGLGWPELCGFLNVPIPKVPYPQANRSKT